jgi:hypothetical protein
VSPTTKNLLEVAAAICTIVGLPIAFYSAYKPEAKVASTTATVQAATASESTSPTDRVDKRQVSQDRNSGTQIGMASSVVINNGVPSFPPASAASVLDAPSKKPVVSLVTFDIDRTKGYWRRTGPSVANKARRGETQFSTTSRWSILSDCLGSLDLYQALESKRRQSCGDSGELLPIFDITFTLDGDLGTVLREIRAVVSRESNEYEGSADDVPSSVIPVSSVYHIKLPDPGVQKTQIARIVPVPPLWLTKDRPTRFQLLLQPTCEVECYYKMRLQFVFSSGQTVSTENFRIDFAETP